MSLLGNRFQASTDRIVDLILPQIKAEFKTELKKLFEKEAQKLVEEAVRAVYKQVSIILDQSADPISTGIIVKLIVDGVERND